MNLRLLYLLLTAIPDLLKLLQALETAREEAALNGKVKDDIKTIHKAFAAKNPAAITAMFSGTPSDPPTLELRE